MRPGDTLNWVVDMADNNNVTGPRTGRSRMHRIHLFDPSKRLDELLAQLDRFVESLTDRLAPLLLRSELASAWVKATTVALKKGDKLAKQLGDRRLDAGDLSGRSLWWQTADRSDRALWGRAGYGGSDGEPYGARPPVPR